MSDFDPGFLRYNDGHAYDGERCVHCGVNIYDALDEVPCVDHEPLVYTTESAWRKVRSENPYRARAAAYREGKGK